MSEEDSFYSSYKNLYETYLGITHKLEAIIAEKRKYTEYLQSVLDIHHIQYDYKKPWVLALIFKFLKISL